MSLALYRKYRPGTFAEVKGQEHVTEPLRQALRTGRINHAYLFSGPRGCGKTSSARILARSLNCEKGPTPDPCGVCESCIALAPTGPGHLDVIEIDAASHGGVDDARDLRERAFFAPVSARYKIYIIDEAHMVTREGFNALLKLVEEPPPHLKFIFATTEPEKVIGTIKSRTHHYPFRLMPPATLRALMEEILTSENVPFEPTALPLVVRAGAGSARDSLSILDQLLAGAEDDGITYAKAVSLLGYTDGDLLDEVVNAFAARDGAQVFHSVNRVIEGGHDPRRFAADLLERFRDLVILANVPEAASSGLLDRPADELERLVQQASSMGPAELTRAAEVFNAGLTEMRGATSPRLLLELMCARVLLPGAAGGEEGLLVRLERLERGSAVAQMAARSSAGTAGGVPSVAPAVPAAPVGGESAGPAAYGVADHGSAGPGSAAGSGQAGSGVAGVGQAGPGSGGSGQAGSNSAAGSGQAGSGSAAGSGQAGSGSAAGPGQAGSGSAAMGSGRAGSGSGSAPAEDDWPETVRPGQGGQTSGAAGSGGMGAPGGGAAYAAGSPGSGAVPGSGAASGPGAASGSVAAPGAGAGAGGGGLASVQMQWAAVLAALKQRSIVVWANVSTNAQVVGVEGNLVTLGFSQVGAMKNFTGGGKDAVVATALGDVLGGTWRVEAVVGGSPPPRASQSHPPTAPNRGSSPGNPGSSAGAPGATASSPGATGYGAPGSSAPAMSASGSANPGGSLGAAGSGGLDGGAAGQGRPGGSAGSVGHGGAGWPDSAAGPMGRDGSGGAPGSVGHGGSDGPGGAAGSVGQAGSGGAAGSAGHGGSGGPAGAAGAVGQGGSGGSGEAAGSAGQAGSGGAAGAMGHSGSGGDAGTVGGGAGQAGGVGVGPGAAGVVGQGGAGSAGVGGSGAAGGSGAHGAGAGARSAPTTDESWPDAPDDGGPGMPPSPDPTQGTPGSGYAAARSAALAAAQAGPRAPAPRQGGSSAWPDAIPGRGRPSDSDDVDPLNDADADVDAVSGMALLQRELGAQVIGEIDHT